MEPTSIVCGVPFYKAPRPGQRDVIERAVGKSKLNVQLPTGYGKTFTAMGVFSVLHSRGDVNRCLYVVPTTVQRDQLAADGKTELSDAGFEGNREITDVSFYGPMETLRRHRNDWSPVFVVTVQSLVYTGAMKTVKELLQQGRWMIVIDEYHHYGEGKSWSKKIHEVSELNGSFLLSMSATPNRPGDDSAFGEPDVVVSYRDGAREQAVKPLVCHSYVYRIEAIEEGQVRTYTTDELVAEAGSDVPEDIERMLISRQMRWSPKYVSPLVSEPINRMEAMRCHFGRLQCLVTAFCCSHAEMVCEQIRMMFPHLKVDWVGTGSRGRSDDDNKTVMDRFCPPKVDGVRRQQDIDVDVLVHVGKAGEGIDCVYVSEVVHLHKASINNTNNQINGRAARFLPGVVGTINVDSSSPYAAFKGAAIMDVMSDVNAVASESEEEQIEDPDDWLDKKPLPEEPCIQIWDLECIRIDRDGLETMKKVVIQQNTQFTMDNVNDPEVVELATAFYRAMKNKEAEQCDIKSVVMQYDDRVEGAAKAFTGLVMRALKSKGYNITKKTAGEVKTRLNIQKKKICGEKQQNVDSLRMHYQFLQQAHARLVETKELPQWLGFE